jgi:dipeptidyl-peptidase-4
MLYSVTTNGKKKEQISKRTGMNTVHFSADFSYCVNRYSNAGTPAYTTVNDAKGNEIRELEANSGLRARMKEYGFSTPEFFTFTSPEIRLANDSSVYLNGWMIKPPGFDATKKYPVLMYVYGGPGSQEVFDGTPKLNSWLQLMAQKGYIVACVDNRGTGFRGAAFRQSTYMQLGRIETEDQIAAAHYLGKQPFVDASRIGIFGWSYGGYMSALCITKGADVFKAAVAVAPVTNWRYYDNIYTERYMRKPQENPAGYDENSPIRHVNDLKGKFLLIHGTADDNVHLQNSMALVTALTEANKPFEMQLYVNENHGIRSGPNSAIHVFGRITDFVLKNL